MVEQEEWVSANRILLKDPISWIDWARIAAYGIWRTQGHVTIDDVRGRCEIYDRWPSHHSIWGGVFRGNGWRIIGTTRSVVKSNHARKIRIWGR